LLALAALLRAVCEQPGLHTEHESLVPALTSQGALARLRIESLGIDGMSLNTLKRVANAVLNGGFAEFDGLRKQCIYAISERSVETNPERSDSRRALQEKVKRLSEQNDRLYEDLLFLTDRLGEAMRQTREYAELAGPSFVTRCRREQRTLLDSLGLRPRVGDLNGPKLDAT